jgi:simple sugar transport system permease protein
VLGLLVIRSLLKRSYRTAAVQGVFAALFLLWYLSTETVPTQLINALPYVVTLLVLALASQHLRMPAADGLRYRKGEAV